MLLLSILVLWLLFYSFKNIYGWMEFRKNTDTPDNFLNKTVNSKEGYTRDSSILSAKFKHQLLVHDGEDFFYSKEYFEGTEIIIDTIVYGPDLNKLGVLILTKNPVYRQLIPDKDKAYYYNATSYLGVRQKDTISLFWLGPNFSNYTDKKELSNEIRKTCFRTFVSKDTTVKYAYKYNLNDIRFWTSTVWQKIEENNIKRKAFEEEKKNHPENVYEPPK